MKLLIKQSKIKSGVWFIAFLYLVFYFVENIFAQEPITSMQEGIVKFNLNDCITYALEHNPSLLAVKASLEASKAGIEKAKSAKYPQLSSGLGVSKSYSNDRWSESWRASVLSLSYTLYDWGRTEGSIKSAELSYEQSLQNFKKSQQDLIYQVKKAFYNVLYTQELVKVAEESVNIAKAHLKDAEARFKAGVASRYEVLRAETELANAQPTLIKAKNAATLALASLKNIIGWEEKEDVQLVLEGTLEYKKIPEVPLEILINQALEQRPDIMQLKLEKESGEVSLKLAKANNKPSLGLSASHSQQASGLTEDWYGSTGASISLSIPLYDGGRTKAMIAQAQASLESILKSLEAKINQVKLEVEQAYLNTKQAEEIIISSEKAIEEAQESYRLAQVRYSSGVGTNLEVMDASLALTRAKTNHAEALFNYLSAQAELEKAIGYISAPFENIEK